jgi:fermentation-respiration switch protein FrsA (DUF1100 family)
VLRVVVPLLVVLLAALVGIALMAEWLKRSSLFFPDRFPVGQWNTSPLAVQPQEFTFRTPRGLRLHAWYFPAAPDGAPLLIWFHGNAGNLSDRGGTAAEFAGRGLSVLLFDYRGYGRSEGRPTEHGLYEDSLAAFDFAVSELQPDRRRIALYGESLGGPYAAHVAARRGGCCVVLENTFPSLVSMARALYPYAPFAFFVSRSLRTTDYLNEARLPVLVMHGRRDQIIPFRLGEELYRGLRVPKEMFVSEESGHSEIPMMESARYYDSVLSFIRKNAP